MFTRPDKKRYHCVLVHFEELKNADEVDKWKRGFSRATVTVDFQLEMSN